MRKRNALLLLCLLLCGSGTGSMVQAAQRVYNAADWGLKPGSGANASPVMQKLLVRMKQECAPGDEVTLRLSAGRYDFYEEGATLREYYISNHDQIQPKRVGLALEELTNFTLDGQGAELVFHGRMLPVALVRSSNCVLKGFSIDFENPHIAQVKVVESTPQEGITFEVAPWVNYRITPDSVFETFGQGWSLQPNLGIAFEPQSKRMVYRTSDLSVATRGAVEVAPRRIRVKGWRDERLLPGTVVVLRTWMRPSPGIFLSHNVDTKLLGVKVHYAEGMGVLAQVCENILLEGCGVCLKGPDDERYFTTQADATHFSGCKGRILSQGGVYENMMDDAINVHGTYLKVVERVNDTTLVGQYVHPQTGGFDWGYPGDEVQFIRASTMELEGRRNRIVAINPCDRPTVNGARTFCITFAESLAASIGGSEGFGIENLTWTPEVAFIDNIVRNNRARGALFSTPQPVWVENNLFDHTSGTAILLCGDCNGWYETGACRRVMIRGNRFVNALTSLFQFTAAVISIYPEIPRLEAQQQYFHGEGKGSIVIEQNEFDTFDYPILYARSVDGLVFRRNTLRTNTDYLPFHPQTNRIVLERATHVQIDPFEPVP